jgi:hypothetical protein
MYEILTKLGHSYNKFPGNIGLEIETETREPYELPRMAFWSTHNDGSLRDFGIEYVLKSPVEITKGIPDALAEFQDKTKGIKFIKDSVTTSVHTHLNMLNESPLTLVRFLTIYTLVENLLVRFAGETRRCNGFALPVCDAEDNYRNILAMIRAVGLVVPGTKKRDFGGHASFTFNEDHAKYAALNVSSLARRGSLECRLLEGTTDIERIKLWVNILFAIVKYARQDKYPNELIIDYKNNGSKILTTIFGDLYPYIKHKDEDELLDRNFYYAGNMAYIIHDWKKILAPIAKRKPASDVDKLAIKMYTMPFEQLTEGQAQQIMNLFAAQMDGGVEDDLEMDDQPVANRAVNLAAQFARVNNEVPILRQEQWEAEARVEIGRNRNRDNF